jgi:hypothetical protein
MIKRFFRNLAIKKQKKNYSRLQTIYMWPTQETCNYQPQEMGAWRMLELMG